MKKLGALVSIGIKRLCTGRKNIALTFCLYDNSLDNGCRMVTLLFCNLLSMCLIFDIRT